MVLNAGRKIMFRSFLVRAASKQLSYHPNVTKQLCYHPFQFHSEVNFSNPDTIQFWDCSDMHSSFF